MYVVFDMTRSIYNAHFSILKSLNFILNAIRRPYILSLDKYIKDDFHPEEKPFFPISSCWKGKAPFTELKMTQAPIDNLPQLETSQCRILKFDCNFVRFKSGCSQITTHISTSWHSQEELQVFSRKSNPAKPFLFHCHIHVCFFKDIFVSFKLGLPSLVQKST